MRGSRSTEPPAWWRQVTAKMRVESTPLCGGPSVSSREMGLLSKGQPETLSGRSRSVWGRLEGPVTSSPRGRDRPRLIRACLPLGWLGLWASEIILFFSPHGMVIHPSHCCREHMGLIPYRCATQGRQRTVEGTQDTVGRRASRPSRSPRQGPAWQEGLTYLLKRNDWVIFLKGKQLY